MGDFNHTETRGSGNWVHEPEFGAGASYPVSILRVIHSRTGAVTPKYREKARNGTLPMLPLDYRYTVIHGGQGTRLTKVVEPGTPATDSVGGDWGVDGVGYWGTKVGITRLTAGEKSGIDAKATTRVLNKIKNQKVNWPQDFGERAQTLYLLTNTVKRLAMAYAAFKSGQLSKAVGILGSAQPSRRFKKKYKVLQKATFNNKLKKGAGRLIYSIEKRPGSGSVFSPKNLASLWLEFQYGWRPLVSSAQGSIETFQQSLEKGEIVKVQSYYRETFERVVNSTTQPSSWQYQDSENVTKGSYKVGYTIYYKLVNTDNHNMAATGFSNPLNLGWELIPFSFVVDWFVGIGNYLSSLDATLGLVFEKGCKTTADRSASTKTTSWRSSYTYVSFSGSVVSTRKDFSVKREVLDSFPAPSRPVLNGWNLGIQNYLTSAALLVTLLGRKPGDKNPIFRAR